MLTLYVLPGCPYCARVLEAGEELGLEFDLHSINDPGVEDELEARGGERKVPFLIDTENGEMLYESKAIVTYLHERFKKDPVT
jgi:glutaredoxin 3